MEKERVIAILNKNYPFFVIPRDARKAAFLNGPESPKVSMAT